MKVLISFVSVLLFIGWGAVFAADSEGVFYFEKNIRPVLVKHCYKCHSAEAKKLKAGLRLDTRAGVRKGGSSGDAIIPGNADDSLLLMMIEEGDMPEEADQLSDEDINTIKMWIAEGAENN